MYTYNDLLDAITAKRVDHNSNRARFIHDFSGVVVHFNMVIAKLDSSGFDMTPNADHTVPVSIEHVNLTNSFRIDTTNMPRHDIKFYLDLSIEELTRVIEGEIEDRFNRYMSIPTDRFTFELVTN